MPIKFGNDDISKIYFGGNEVSKIYMGQTLVYQAGSEPPTPTSYEIGFRGMSLSTPALTRTGQAVGATWSATSGVISIVGIDLTKIWGGYVGNDGEELTWDGANLKYQSNGVDYTGNVFVKLNRFFAKPVYENGVLDGFDLHFGDSAPDASYEDWFLGKDHIAVGCYKARGGGMSSGLQSKQGLSYNSSVSANAIVTAYKLNSSSAYSLHEEWYNESTILQVLFMAIFGTRQTEDVFPQATYRHYSNDTRATGYMDSYRATTLCAYEPTGDSGKRGNMFLGIEDFIGWGRELVCGLVVSGSDLKPSVDYANFSYSGDYSTADVGLSGVTSSGNYIKTMQISQSAVGLMVPGVADGTAGDSTYFCDAVYTGGTCVYRGATYPNATYGVFSFYATYDASSAASNFAARLCGKPV